MKRLLSLFTAVAMMAVGVSAASAASRSYCDAQARQYANQYANPAANTVGGAMGGAVTGCIAGAIFGGKNGCGKGAAAGAVIGGVGGAASSGSRWQQLYNDAYYKCMNTPPPGPAPSYGQPPVGSYQWKQACSRKYKSFNWDTGYFYGYDGQYHLCHLP